MEALRAALGLGVIVMIAWIIYYGVTRVLEFVGDRVFGRQTHRK